MKLMPAVSMVLVLAMGLAFAQTATAEQAGDTTKPVADTSKPATKPQVLKLSSVNGDTFDLLSFRQTRVILVVGTDSASGVAAELVQKAFAAATEPAMYFAVIEAGMKQARAAAGQWQLGYTVLSDSGSKTMQWFSANLTARMLSPKARPPLVAFMDATGKVTKVETSVTEAGVIQGVKDMSKSEETMVDPVCGMTISKKTAAATYDYNGKTYYFCSASCKDIFARDPQRYVR